MLLTKPLIAVFMLAFLAAALGSAPQAGPLKSIADEAAAKAERAREATDQLRGDEPFPYRREALRRHRIALERAERRQERAAFKASEAARHAERDARRSILRDRKRAARDKRRARKERDERQRRDMDASNPR